MEAIRRNNFLSESGFRKMIRNDFSRIITKDRDFDISIRPSEKQEFNSDGRRMSEGGTIGRGDIVVSSLHGNSKLYLFIGAKFDAGDFFVSHARRITYDLVFDKVGLHDLHLWRPGKRGSAYSNELSTPFIEIPINDDTQEILLNTYEHAVKYLRVIDSPQFDAVVIDLRRSGLEGISILLRQLESKTTM